MIAITTVQKLIKLLQGDIDRYLLDKVDIENLIQNCSKELVEINAVIEYETSIYDANNAALKDIKWDFLTFYQRQNHKKIAIENQIKHLEIAKNALILTLEECYRDKKRYEKLMNKLCEKEKAEIKRKENTILDEIGLSKFQTKAEDH